ncbi:MAG: hypothetical protein JWQ71_4286 [Pedosphaera sp.]|nr:hypothetical protein [Pedosphaera sp.]
MQPLMDADGNGHKCVEKPRSRAFAQVLMNNIYSVAVLSSVDGMGLKRRERRAPWRERCGLVFVLEGLENVDSLILLRPGSFQTGIVALQWNAPTGCRRSDSRSRRWLRERSFPVDDYKKSVGQKGAVGGFEADGFRQGLGIKFDDDDMIAGGHIGDAVGHGLAIDPDGAAIGTGQLDVNGAGLGDLDLGGGVNGFGIAAADGVQCALQLGAQQTAIDEGGRGLPIGISEFAVEHLVVAELGNVDGRREQAPETGDVAFGGIVFAGLAQVGKEAEQIQTLTAAQGIDEAGRHEGVALFAVLDAVLGDGDFLVGGIAEDELFGVFANEHAGHFFAIIGFYDDGMIAFLDFAIRIKNRFDQVIHLSTCADAGHIGANFSADTADGMATDAANFLAPENLFTARGIAFANSALGQQFDFGIRKPLPFAFQIGTACQCDDQVRLIAPAFARGFQAGFRHRRRKTSLGQRMNQCRGNAFGAEQRTPEVQRFSFGFGIVEQRNHRLFGLLHVQTDEGQDGSATNRFITGLFSERNQVGNHFLATNFAQGIEGGTPGGFGGLFVGGDGEDTRCQRFTLPGACEAQGGFADLFVGAGKEFADGIQVAGGLGVALLGRVSKSSQGADGGFIIETTANNLIEEVTQFVLAAALPDEFNPWAVAIFGNGFGFYHLAQNQTRLTWFNSFQGEFQLLLAAIGFPRAGLDGFDPGFGKVVDAQPDGVIKKGVHGFVQNAQHEFRGTGRGHFGERTHGFNAHTGKIIGYAFRQQVHGILQTRMPVAHDARGGGADVAVLGFEQLIQQRGFNDIDGLIHPERFEQRFFARLGLGPFGEVGGNGGAALGENAFGLLLIVFVGGQQLIEQLAVRCFDEVRTLHQGTALGGDAPDAAVFVVAAGITEIDFAMLDNGIGPIGDVERAVGAHFYVDGAEGHVRAANQVRHFLGDVSGIFFIDGEANDAMSTEIAGDHVALPIIGELLAVNDFERGELGVAAGADAFQLTAYSGIGKVSRAGNAKSNALASRAVRDKGLPVFIELVAPGIAETLEIDAEFHCGRAQMPETTAVQSLDAVGCFDMAVNVNGLVKVKLTVMAPMQSVDDMMGVFRAEAGKDDALLVGLAIAIGVLEMKEFGALADIDAAIARFDAGGDEQAIGEDGGFIDFAHALGVFENENLVVGFVPRFDLGINRGADNPETSKGIEVHLNGLGEQRAFGVKADFKSGSDFEFRQGLRSGIGGGRRSDSRFLCLIGFFIRPRFGGGNEFVVVSDGLPQFGDPSFLFGDEKVEHGDFPGVLALLVFAETEQIGFVLGTPAIEVELVFLEDDFAEFFGLVPLWAALDGDAPAPFLAGAGGNGDAVRLEVITTGLQTIDLDERWGIGSRDSSLFVAQNGADELIINAGEADMVAGSLKIGNLGAVTAIGDFAIGGDTDAPEIGFPDKAFFQGFGHAQVTEVVEMNAVFGKGARKAALGAIAHEVVVKRDEMTFAFRGEIANRLGVQGQLAIMFRGVRQWRAEIFVMDGAYQDELQRFVGADRLNCIHQLDHVGLELIQARFAIKGIGHAIADNNYRGLHGGNLILQLFKAFARFIKIETGARAARRCVRTPAQIAEDDVPLRIANRKSLLYKAIRLLAFDERIAHEYDAIAVSQFQGWLGLCCYGKREG